MLISEDLLLLLTRDDGKPESSFTYAAYGYAAGNVTDLVLRQRVTLSDHKDPRVHVTDPGPTGHPVLDAVLTRLGEKDGRKLSSVITDKAVAAEDQIVDSLHQAGIVEVEPKRMLGLVGERRPVTDPSRERAVRERLRVVLAGAQATPSESTLLAVLCGLEMAPKVLTDETPLRGRRLTRRIEEITAEVEAADSVDAAVRSAVSSMNAVIVTAAIIPAITSTTTS